MNSQRRAVAEVISIGDELHRGEVVDTNAAWIGSQLLKQGILVQHRQGVSDQKEEIQKALVLAASRSDLVFVTGGLGPTSDDVTVDAVSSLLSVPSVYEPEHKKRLEERQKTNKDASPSFRQVRIPEGATVLTNSKGSAPGFSIEWQKAVFFFFPGVPREMKSMFEDQVLPMLRVQQKSSETYVHRTYRIFGLRESDISQRLQGVFAENDINSGNIHLHYRLSFPEVLVIVVASGVSTMEAEGRIEQFDSLCRQRLGSYLYGQGEEGLPFVVVQKLSARMETLVTAESCTGGLLGELLTAVPGVSANYLGGLIAYHNDFKKEYLGVSQEILERDGAVSSRCVITMADHLRLDRKATYGLAISGIAGPSGGTEEKPVGTIYIALSMEGQVQVRHFVWPLLDREQIRWRATYAALDLLDRYLSPHRNEEIG